MIARSNFDQFLVFIFFAIAILFQILTKAAAKSRKRPTDTQRRSTAPPQTSRPPSREENETDEEQIRKFLEALGQPTTSKPPEPIQPRPTYRSPAVFPPPMKSPLPPLTTRPPEAEADWPSPRQFTPPIPAPPKPERRVYQPKVAEPTAFEVHEGPPPITESEVKAAFQPAGAQQSQSKREDFTTLLRSTSGLREAIILREIFGPPRSMQPFDSAGSV